jgi:hypothetical protein
VSKLASLVLIVGGSLLFVGAAAAQGDPGYSSGGQPAYAAPGGATVGPRAEGGGIKDNAGHHRPMTGSLMLATPWRYGFGVGFTGAFEIPIVHNGFISAINNSVSIEPFLTIGWSSYNHAYNLYNEDDFHAWTYTPGVAGLWSFYFSPKLRVYGAVRLGVTIISPSYDGPNNNNVKFDNDTDFFFEVAPGVVYSLNERIALRADVGWWSGIKGGIAILL